MSKELLGRNCGIVGSRYVTRFCSAGMVDDDAVVAEGFPRVEEAAGFDGTEAKGKDVPLRKLGEGISCIVLLSSTGLGC